MTLRIVDAWSVYDRSPAMMPTVVYTAEGELLASYHTVAEGMPGGEVYLMRSRDHGRTWSTPVRVARSRKPNGGACSPLSLTVLRDGMLLLPYRDEVTGPGHVNNDITLYILRSTDHGHSWEETTVLGDLYEPIGYGQIVERDDGVLLCPVFGRVQPEERWRSALLFSYDRGMTWRDYTVVAYDPEARLASEYAHPANTGFDEQGRFDPQAIRRPNFRPHATVDGFNEMSVIPLADRRLLAILRQQGVEGTEELLFFRSLSEDGGHTWSPYQRTNLCGMSPCLHVSPSGRLLLAYRRCAPENDPERTPGLSVAWSRDAGLTWEELVTLREPRGTRYVAEYQVGYPSIVNTPDGHILVFYYSYDNALPHGRYLAANLLREEAPS